MKFIWCALSASLSLDLGDVEFIDRLWLVLFMAAAVDDGIECEGLFKKSASRPQAWTPSVGRV